VRHRLAEDRLNERKLLDWLAADQAIAGDAPYLFARSFLPIRKEREKIERPGERLRRRFVAGKQKGHHILDDPAVGERGAGGGIPCRHQPSE
jgi:hypothetical protein